ncbi:MAG: type II toxin-antitoxin system RelE/ParE family toxin [Nitrospinae bacterium]|nr:type II toxin-antitoxin system RelE/ParE family toxin [Nitrospinota bacterium]
MYELKFLEEAQQELEREIEYSAENWGAAHALKYAKKMEEQIKALQINPHICPLRNDILPGIRIKKYKGNQIIFTLQENQKLIVMLAILSICQNMDKEKLAQRQKKG